MIIAIEGDNGSGKNCLLAMISEQIKDKPIWSNFELFKHPNYSELFLDNIIHMENHYNEYKKGLVIFIDEAYTYFESRLSNRSTNIYLSYKTNYQWRKRLLDVYLTFQDITSIDKRFRMRFDIIIQCKYREPFSQEPFQFTYLKVKQHKNRFNRKVLYTRTYPYKYMKQYFALFDTNQIIEPSNIAMMEYNMIKDNPRLLKRTLNRYYDILLPQVEQLYNGNMTHDDLDLLLTSNLILDKYQPKLYRMLKNKIRL
jgi:deoxyadenosine/deoxycytidine kinase